MEELLEQILEELRDLNSNVQAIKSSTGMMEIDVSSINEKLIKMNDKLRNIDNKTK